MLLDTRSLGFGLCPCRDIGGEYTHDADFLVFEGNHYRNGFMYKSFGMSAIIHEGVKPTLQELEKFEATPEEVEIEGLCSISNWRGEGGRQTTLAVLLFWMVYY